MSALPRSYLFVPGNRTDRFDKALASGADCVVLDLEDVVPRDAKSSARDAVVTFLTVTPHRDRIVVRVNDESTEWFEDDLAALRRAASTTVMLPKSERAETVDLVRAVCPDIAVVPLIESAKGVLAARVIAATDGVQRLAFGTIDYALDMDLQGPLATTVGLDYAASQLAIVSRAAGIESPIAGVTVAVNDEDALRSDLSRSRAHGFGAKLCIHPRQISAVHTELAASLEELAWAKRVLDAASDSRGAAVQLAGQMIDKPVIERALRVIRRA